MTAAPPAVAPRSTVQAKGAVAGFIARVLTLDIVVLAAMLGLAAAARWPNLWLIPTFTDETLEVRLAYDIVRGAAAPLTSVDPYIGAFWNWVLALTFWVFGLSPWLPRLLVFITGVLTVGATWWLGRELGGRVAGVVAALFMAGCSTHILVNSHVAWSHATTPLWTTLGLAFLLRALRGERGDLTPSARQGDFTPQPLRGATIGGADIPLRRGEGEDGPLRVHSSVRGPVTERDGTSMHVFPLSGAERGAGGMKSLGLALIGTGFFTGLGIQTHITAVLLLPGIGLTILFQRAGLLRTRWAAFAILAFAVATANLIVFNVMTGGGTLTGGQAVLADYTGQDDGPDASAYTENLGRLTLATSWVLSGAIEKRRFVGETLAQPLLLGYLGLAVGGVLWAARRGTWLPLLVSVPYLLALPVLQGKYEPLLNGRYVMPILPLLFASIGLVVADSSRWLASRWPARAAVTGGVLLGLTVLVALYPLAPLARYQRNARTNHPILAAYEAVLAGRHADETVLVDYGLDGVFFMAAGSAFKATELLLGGSSVPYTVIDARPASLEDALHGYDSRLLVLNTDKVRNLNRNFTLSPLMGGERDGPGFGVFRVSARSS